MKAAGGSATAKRIANVSVSRLGLVACPARGLRASCNRCVIRPRRVHAGATVARSEPSATLKAFQPFLPSFRVAAGIPSHAADRAPAGSVRLNLSPAFKERQSV